MIAKQMIDRFMQALFFGQPLVVPSQLWLGLIGEGGEVGLPRQPMNPADWRADDGEAMNGDEVRFPETDRDMGKIIGAALYDAESGGSVIATFDMSEPRNLERRTIVVFSRGDLRVRMM